MKYIHRQRRCLRDTDSMWIDNNNKMLNFGSKQILYLYSIQSRNFSPPSVYSYDHSIVIKRDSVGNSFIRIVQLNQTASNTRRFNAIPPKSRINNCRQNWHILVYCYLTSLFSLLLQFDGPIQLNVCIVHLTWLKPLT